RGDWEARGTDRGGERLEVRGQIAEVNKPLQSDLRPRQSALLRYSLDWRKKCDNRFDGRNSILYVTLRRTLRLAYATQEAARGSKFYSLCPMPVTQIPPRDPLSRDSLSRESVTPLTEQAEQRDLFEAQHWETAYRSFNPDDVPHLLIQLQDDLSRARKREALWLSVILHLFVIILLWNSEKLMMLLPHKTVDLAISTNADKSKDATFLELPPDAQKLTRRPDAKVISDKDRIATSKAPQINRDD